MTAATDRTPATALLVVVTTIGATFAILVAGGAGPQALPVRVVYDAMAAAILISWLAVAAFRPTWRPTSRLWPAIVAILAAFVIATATSKVPRLSAEMLAYALLLAELYLFLVALMRRPATRAHLERLALLLCLLVGGLYLLQVVGEWITWWGLVGRPAIPPLRPSYLGLSLGSPNPVATLVLALGAFALATNPLTGPARRVLDGGLVGLVAVVTVITGSRGAWLGAIVGLIATVGAAMIARPESRRRTVGFVRSRRGVAVALVLLPVIGVAALLAVMSGRLTLDDGGYRQAFAEASLRMFDSAPVTGVGPGTWPVLRAANTVAPAPDLYIPHAHDIYLQTLAEFGVVGVVAGVVVLASVASLLWWAIRSEARTRRHVAFATLFVLVVLAVQQIADVLVNVPALAVAVALPVAWLDAQAQPGPTSGDDARGSRDRLGRWTVVAAAVLTVVVLAGLLWIEADAWTARQGVVAADDGRWADAAALAKDAVKADPDLNLYRFQLGVSAANAGDLPLAEASLATSAATDDYAYAWLDLAAVRWRLGDPAGARDALARAERLGLQRTPLSVAAGWLHQQLGDTDAAIDDYAVAVAQAPTLADDPFWSSPAGPPGGPEAILDVVRRRADPTTRLRVDLVSGRLDLAAAEITLVSADPAFVPNLIPAWNGDQAAWAALQGWASDRPLDSGPVGWCRFVAAHLGDDAAVDRFGRWLSIMGTSDSTIPPVGRITLAAPQGMPPLFLDRYGSLYRRDDLSAQVVSILPQVVYQDHP